MLHNVLAENVALTSKNSTCRAHGIAESPASLLCTNSRSKTHFQAANLPVCAGVFLRIAPDLQIFAITMQRQACHETTPRVLPRSQGGISTASGAHGRWVGPIFVILQWWIPWGKSPKCLAIGKMCGHHWAAEIYTSIWSWYSVCSWQGTAWAVLWGLWVWRTKGSLAPLLIICIHQWQM